MNNEMETKFEKMGARVKVQAIDVLSLPRLPGNRRFRSIAPAAPIRVDIRRDDRGEYFDVRHRGNVAVEVIDVRPSDRHLLLMAREVGGDKSKFLCGHDERAWFVAAVPESARVANVQDAKDALKPQEVWDAMREFGVPRDRRDHRRTAAFGRQGEWFFIPRPGFRMDVRFALQNEPIRRGAGKPHKCQFLYRTGGETVYVGTRNPNGLTTAEYRELTRKEQLAWSWRQMVRDAHVYVKGTVRHPDHKTITLMVWHEVVMNTETQARAMQHVAFLD